MLATHPLNGARLHEHHPDKKHLLQGPVTVFDEGRYAGDARLDDVPPGQTRLLSYGIDLQNSVNVKNLDTDRAERSQTGKIVKGVLELTRKRVSAKEYSIENKSDHDKTLVIEHPLRAGWKLVDTPAARRDDRHAVSFRTGRRGGQDGTVHREGGERPAGSRIGILPWDGDMQFYSQTGEIPHPCGTHWRRR